MDEMRLLGVICKDGKARKMLKHTKQFGVLGGTIFLGKGITKRKKSLNVLDVADSRLEVLLILSAKNTAQTAMESLNEKYHFENPTKGWAFTMPIDQILGSQNYSKEKHSYGGHSMYKAIYTIVDKGKAEKVINAAETQGIKEGFIINARGSSIHEKQKLFNMDITPEKEMVLLLVSSDHADRITTAIRSELGIDEPGQGIIFMQSIDHAHGID